MTNKSLKRQVFDDGRLPDITHRFEQLRSSAAGRLSAATGELVEVTGLAGHAPVGARLALNTAHGTILAEVIGVREGQARALPFASIGGLSPGLVVQAPVPARSATLPIDDGWLGRVVDPLGRPLDGQGPLPRGVDRLVRADPPPAAGRARLGPRIGLGIRAIDLFASCRSGQRLGLFAGSGVGKSTLLAMLARNVASAGAGCDVAILALIGERGREVREFLEDDLGPEGLARSVVVVATSDQPALMRREAAFAALAIAEHFRDQGRSVLLMMDSVTRFCLALREIGLAAGELPATRGYPPSVWSELPRLLERAGPGLDRDGAGQITGIFTVLVEGGDHDEPVADAARGILDGHVVLDRKIADGGRYPAIDVLRSLSRTVPGCLSPAQAVLVSRARAILAVAADMADLVRLGAYRRGTDPGVDEALDLAPRIEDAIRQSRGQQAGADDGFLRLQQAIDLAPDNN